MTGTAPTTPASAADLPLTRSFSVGSLRVHAIEGGLVRLDGGAMFGVVPKPLWEKRIPADSRNRITLALRCLLVETADELVLIETGVGMKENEKFTAIYGIEAAPPEGAAGADRLQAGIAELGFGLDEVGVVVNTHLHFDHAGGNTTRLADGSLSLSFPRATYVVQRGEWEYAHSANERTRASYLGHNYDPVDAAGRLQLVEGPGEIVPGIEVELTPGHTPFHQSVLIRSDGETACFLADVAPTMSHLPFAWIMGYDVEPLVTLESKRGLLTRAARERWLLLSGHDAVYPGGRIRIEDGDVHFDPGLSAG